MATVADRITLIMNRRGLSQRDLEKAAGLSERHMSMILEREGGMHKKTRAKVAKALGVSEGWLLTGEGAVDVNVVNDMSAAQAKPKALTSAFSPIQLDKIINAAFVASIHMPSDTNAVRQLFAEGFTLANPSNAPVFVRALIDAAARLRLAGEEVITSPRLLESLALRVAELEAPASERLPVSGGRPPSQPGPTHKATG